MTNAQVFAAFATRSEAKGGSVRSERFAEGVVLYSYSTPIAYFPTQADRPVFTERRFSSTTSRQQSQAKRACGSWDEKSDADFRTFGKQLGVSFAFAR
jgi:hypothetical protein